MATDEIVLFDERIDTQRVRVWLERTPDGGITLFSHDIGPKLERFFGDDEIETYLEIDATNLPALATSPSLAGHTERGTTIRLIFARRATVPERMDDEHA